MADLYWEWERQVVQADSASGLEHGVNDVSARHHLGHKRKKSSLSRSWSSWEETSKEVDVIYLVYCFFVAVAKYFTKTT